MEKECFYPNMERVIIKNQNLIKLRELIDYEVA